MVEIKRITINDLDKAPNILALFEEYAAESAIEGLPPVAAKLSIYNGLEESGALKVIGAYINGVLVGFLTVLVPLVPHYGIAVAVSESFFVAKEYRKSGAGDKLRIAAEEYAKEVGSPGLLLSAPHEGILERILPHKGYKETNRVFFKNFNE